MPNLLETEKEIKKSEFPQAVWAILSKNFTGYKFNEIERACVAKGDTSSEMEASKGKEKLEFFFGFNREIIGKRIDKSGKERKRLNLDINSIKKFRQLNEITA